MAVYYCLTMAAESAQCCVSVAAGLFVRDDLFRVSVVLTRPNAGGDHTNVLMNFSYIRVDISEFSSKVIYKIK